VKNHFLGTIDGLLGLKKMKELKSKIVCVVGLGYVGLPLVGARYGLRE